MGISYKHIKPSVPINSCKFQNPVKRRIVLNILFCDVINASITKVI